MKIKLIEPSRYIDQATLLKTKELLFPSLTLPLLAALTPKDIEVSIINEKCSDIDFNEKIDLVGITAYTSDIFRAYQIADEFRKRGVYVVMGGIHVSLESDEASGHADTLILGEAEELWPKFLEDFKLGKHQKIYKSDKRPGLAKLPVPRYDLLDSQAYISNRRKGIYKFLPLPLVPIQTARGCPHGCDFCSVTTFFGGEFRMRPIEEVVNEIKALKAKTCFFLDDNIFGNPVRAKELLKALIPLKIIWTGQATMMASNDPELMDLARKSGCVLLAIGMESLSPKVLESMGKKINQVQEYEKQLANYRKAGIAPALHMIFGFELDEAEVFKQSYDFLMKNSVPYSLWWPITPFPGTKLYAKLKTQNRLKTQKWWLSPVRNLDLKFTGTLISEDFFIENFTKYYLRFYSLKSILKRNIFPLQKRFLLKILINLIFKKKIENIKICGNLT